MFDEAYPSVYDTIVEEELNEMFIKFGSLYSMLHDKHLSVTVVFSDLLNLPDVRKILLNFIGVSEMELYKHVLERYPLVRKSKRIQHRNERD
jgi:hypothetical protein